MRKFSIVIIAAACSVFALPALAQSAGGGATGAPAQGGMGNGMNGDMTGNGAPPMMQNGTDAGGMKKGTMSNGASQNGGMSGQPGSGSSSTGMGTSGGSSK